MMPVAQAAPVGSAGRRWRTATLGAAGAWGILHVVGGLALAAQAVGDSGAAALRALASAAPADQIPSRTGAVTEAVLAFHGANIAAAGVAVLLISARTARRDWPTGVGMAMVIMAVLDAGLLAFLLVPGHMRMGDGIWGPLLLMVAAVSARQAGWTWRRECQVAPGRSGR